MVSKDKHVTQIFLEPLKAQERSPSAASSASMSDELHRPLGDNQTKLISKRKASAEHEPPRKVLAGQPKDLHLPNMVKMGSSTAQSCVVRNGSPWDIFREDFICDLAGPVSIAVHRTNPSRVLAIRAFSKISAEKVLRIFQQTRHHNIISATEIFRDDGVLYAVLDDFPLTLDHVVACDVFPGELQLASILAQVVNGLSYLLETGLEHQALTCSNILLGFDGLIQIAALEHCVERQPDRSQAQSLSALTTMTILLMQKYVKADGVVGIDDVDRWPVGSESVEFLSATTSVVTVGVLKKHPLITKKHWSPGELVGLARLSLISTHTFITNP